MVKCSVFTTIKIMLFSPDNWRRSWFPMWMINRWKKYFLKIEFLKPFTFQWRPKLQFNYINFLARPTREILTRKEASWDRSLCGWGFWKAIRTRSRKWGYKIWINIKKPLKFLTFQLFFKESFTAYATKRLAWSWQRRWYT